MPSTTGDKVKQTQQSFPAQPPGAVSPCVSGMNQAANEAQNTPAGQNTPASEAKKKNGNWIEIAMVGMDDKPVPNIRYQLTLPDGTKKEGRLDENGKAAYYEITPGSCVITFPELDKDAWS